MRTSDVVSYLVNHNFCICGQCPRGRRECVVGHLPVEFELLSRRRGTLAAFSSGARLDRGLGSQPMQATMCIEIGPRLDQIFSTHAG